MTLYWLAFLIPAVAAVIPVSLKRTQRRFVWLVTALCYVIFIGFRHQVGGDWFTYELHFFTASQGLDWALDFGDPGYYVTGWLISALGGSVYWLNLFCALLLVAGTVRFARAQPRPWLAFAVAVPYLLIVVGMGYTRQAAAIGLVMWGLVSLHRGAVRSFALAVLLGALFHKTALLMLPIAALAASGSRIWTSLWIGALTALGYYTLLESDVQTLYANYIDSDYAFASEGAAVRVAMNAVAAVVFVLFSRRLVPDRAQRRLFWWMAIITLVSVPLLALSPTAVDRMALYLIPLQLVVFSRIPDLARTARIRHTLTISVVAYYALVEYVWLNHASHAFAWIPYQFAPLDQVF